MTSEDVRNTRFELVRKGYSPEEVDDFMEMAAIQIDALTAEKEDYETKLRVLAQKVEEYRGQEDTLKTAMINAQRMGETIMHEAKQKAEGLIRDAEGKSQLLHQQAEQEIKNEQFMLEKLREEVTRFRTTVLSLYKQHIESFSALDAPVVRVEEFLTEYQYASQPYVPPEQTETVQVQPVLIDAETPDAEEKMGEPAPETGDLRDMPPITFEEPALQSIEGDDTETANNSSYSRFGGIPIDNENDDDIFVPTPKRKTSGGDKDTKSKGKK